MLQKFIDLVSFSILFIFLASCEDHRIVQGGQRFRLKTLTTNVGSYSNTTTFNYKENGQLDTYIESDFGIVTKAEYDSLNRLISLQQNAVFPGRSTYEYDRNNRLVIKKDYLPTIIGTFALSRKDSLEYGASNVPIKIDRTVYSSSLGQVYFDFTYQNGNIVKVVFDDSYSKTVSNINQYDDKPNPFYGLILIGSSYDVFNKNNAIYPNVKYEYNSNGLLSRVIDNNQTPTPSIIAYEYETY